MVLRVQNPRALYSSLQTTALRERGSAWLPCPKPLIRAERERPNGRRRKTPVHL